MDPRVVHIRSVVTARTDTSTSSRGRMIDGGMQVWARGLGYWWEKMWMASVCALVRFLFYLNTLYIFYIYIYIVHLRII